MIVRCVSVLPTNTQAKQLGEHFRGGKEEFGLSRGQSYVVFGIKLLSGQPWVELTDPDIWPGYLFAAPLVLFEIMDGRIPAGWQIGFSKTGNLRIAAPELFDEYFHDDLIEGDEAVVAKFVKLRRQLEAHAGIAGA